MAAAVSSFSRMAKVCMEEAEEGTELVTRDLIGSAASASPEVDLELQIPAGWDSCLDLSSGNSYLPQRRKIGPAPRHLHVDLNFTPSIALLRTSALKIPSGVLHLPRPLPQRLHPGESQVCARAGVASRRQHQPPFRAPLSFPATPSLSSATTITITTCSSTTESRPAAEQHEDSFESTCGRPAMAVAACPGCLLYVLICKADPRCLKCAVSVPINHLNKKPRIDLNFSLRNGGGGEHQRRHEDE